MNFSHGGNPEQIGRQYGIPPDRILDFSANINPLGPPPSSRAAIEEAFHLLPRYPDIEANSLRRAIAEYEGVPLEFVFPCNGAADGLFHLVRQMSPKKAAIFCPAFSEYQEACQSVGSEVIPIVPTSPDRFDYDVSLLSRIPEGIDLLFLCTPANPTGAVAGTDFQNALFRLADRRKFRLLIDESFLDFRSDGRSLSAVPFCRRHPGIIVLKSLTKFFALAGARIGYALSADTKLLRQTEASSPPWTINIFAERLAVGALQETDYINSTRSFVEREGQFLFHSLAAIPLIHPAPPGANFVLFRVEKPLPLQELLLRENILIRECGSFVGLDNSYFRICVSSREKNTLFLNALNRVIAQNTGTDPKI